MAVQNYTTKLSLAKELDANDPLKSFRDRFLIPQDREGNEVIYFCGNSLGLQPKSAKSFIDKELERWKNLGIEGYFDGDKPWLKMHEELSQKMAPVVGALPHEVIVMNTLTTNLHLMLTSFYRPSQKRHKVLIESDTFPSDIYAIESHIRLHGFDPKKSLSRLSPRQDEHCLRKEDILEFIDREGDNIALILIGNTNYYTGQRFDLKAITEKAHERGCLIGFDCAHGAGNVPLNLHDSGCDFAVWCNYKYLNSGPGSPGGYFVHDRYANARDLPRLAGWWGHREEIRFNMRDEFVPMHGAAGWQISCPLVFGLASVYASLDIFLEADINRLRKKSIELTGYFYYLLNALDSPHLEIITPADQEKRGAQLSVLFKKNGQKIFQTLKDKGVIADWREPNVIRFAPTPLYNSYQEVYQLYNIISLSLN